MIEYHIRNRALIKLKCSKVLFSRQFKVLLHFTAGNLIQHIYINSSNSLGTSCQCCVYKRVPTKDHFNPV